MPQRKERLVISRTSQLWDQRTRRDFLKLMGIGGAVVLLPGVLTACSDDDNNIMGPGTGSTVTIDFAKGDIAVLQFAYALEQLEADFYTRVASNFSSSGLNASEQAVFGDIKNHEVIHRDALKTVLGATNGFTLVPVYNGVNFSSRSSILSTALTFEELGVAAYNGAGQYLSSTANLLVAGKIVSVEARHASVIADIIAPKTSAFAPKAFDDAFSPAKVANAAQAFITEKLAFAGSPPAFVQGPNNNG
jgi:hypothetical protein